MRKYKLRYKFEVQRGDFTAEEVMEWGGGCDAFIFSSILRTDGALSTLTLGRDGDRPADSDDIEDSEIFKAWIAMASDLMNSKDLGEGRKMVCAFVLQQVQAAILGEGDRGCPACGSKTGWKKLLGNKSEHARDWFRGFLCYSCGHEVQFKYWMPVPDQDGGQ